MRDGSTEESHVARIKVFLSNEPGTLGDLSTIIGKNGGNITNLRICQPVDRLFRDPS